MLKFIDLVILDSFIVSIKWYHTARLSHGLNNWALENLALGRYANLTLATDPQSGDCFPHEKEDQESGVM